MMCRTRFQRLRRLVFPALACASFAACSASEPPGVENLLRLAPSLSPKLARHLVVSNDSTLAAFVHTLDVDHVSDQIESLWQAERVRSVERHEHAKLVILPAIERLVNYIPDHYARQRSREHVARVRSTSSEARVRRFLLDDEFNRVRADTAMTTDEKIEAVTQIRGEFMAMDLPGHAGNIDGVIAGLLVNDGRYTEALSHYRMALSKFYQAGDYNMACQALGVIGGYFSRESKADSMKFYWDKALAVAREHGIAFQMARISSFYAAYYSRQGKLALAHELYNDAIRISREYGDHQGELRFVIAAMEHYATLEAWEVVGRLLPQARTVERPWIERYEKAGAGDMQSASLDQIEARYLMTRRNVDKANELYERAAAAYTNLHRSDLRMKTVHQWATDLVANGRWDDALNQTRDGSAFAQRSKNDRYIARFSLVRAAASMALGNHDDARRELDGFDALVRADDNTLLREWIERDVLRIKLAFANADTSRAYAAVTEALRRVEQVAGGLDGSVQSYLWIGACDEVRQLLHDLVADDVRLGLGVEFYWRGLSRTLGGRQAAAESFGLLAEQDPRVAIRGVLSRCAEEVTTRITDAGAVHCVFVTRREEVWRWTVSESGLSRDVLEVPAKDLATTVKHCVEQMSAAPVDPDATPSSGLTSQLRDLAAALLPPEIVDGTTNPETALYVSAEGMLAKLPFEALNVQTSGSYDPLLRHRDVGYVRYVEPAPEALNYGRGVVLVNAECSQSAEQLSSHRELEAAQSEAERARRSLPASTVFDGDMATKANLTGEWEDASYIYAATHVVRDPEVPYLMHILLATDNGTDREAAYLDVGDIRSADLSDCNLVVLSGCSSGTPYVGMRNWAPSLGDAFLDAGAGVAVQTLWDVKDEDAADLMMSFIDYWRASPARDAFRSMCNVRREALEGPHGPRHPHSWAAYSINLGQL